eukprot:CAMPEP_0202748834 /NCGR_PEP_ID=MMETSP1388-20130828/10066_1 /ASSEMBLY_ACC=CAM_ASM_000864 /TAXON_ID=37098 /ORGANISM="Isochrysis sp, Strain CCMP1244" /LENGTH=233 /DNA_ID=CAMNT_0049416281 /DNA_START=102 /DNA_END=801 /DNA_ORIENTATION=-
MRVDWCSGSGGVAGVGWNAGGEGVVHAETAWAARQWPTSTIASGARGGRSASMRAPLPSRAVCRAGPKAQPHRHVEPAPEEEKTRVAEPAHLGEVGGQRHAGHQAEADQPLVERQLLGGARAEHCAVGNGDVQDAKQRRGSQAGPKPLLELLFGVGERKVQLQQSHADGDDGLVARDGGEGAAGDALEAEEERDGEAAERAGEEDRPDGPAGKLRDLAEAHREHRACSDEQLA